MCVSLSSGDELLLQVDSGVLYPNRKVKVHIFNSFFFLNLSQFGFSRVCQWTKKVGPSMTCCGMGVVYILVWRVSFSVKDGIFVCMLLSRLHLAPFKPPSCCVSSIEQFLMSFLVNSQDLKKNASLVLKKKVTLMPASSLNKLVCECTV